MMGGIVTGGDRRPGERTKAEWRQSMRPRIDAARDALRLHDVGEIAERAGASITAEGLSVKLFGEPYALAWPELTVRTSRGKDVPEELAILLLDYLVRADGGPLSGRWIGFQELPDGAFYRRAFQGYTGDQLVRELRGDPDAFRRSAEELGGEAISMGDAGYAFVVLPRVRMAVIWWSGDEEFPAKAHVLFDAVASTYLPTDGLAIIGRMLCRQLVAVGPAS